LLHHLRHLDESVDLAFDRLRGHPRADWIAYVASEAADYSLAWHAINTTIAVVSPSRRRHAIRLAATLGVESLLVNGVIKRLVKRERPPLPAERAYLVRRPRTQSFPSGHASSATVAGVLLTDAVPQLTPLWAMLSATVAASRIHNRMHHASDVVAGAALGLLVAEAARRLRPLP
jgi:undecaprenyl-diphosphatase